jgi:hypothetical protein
MTRLAIKTLVVGLAWAGLLTAVRADDTNSQPFAVGEKLDYTIYWGPFSVGRATLEVAGKEVLNGQECYPLIAQAKTSGIAESLYPVRSKTESWWDVDELISRKYIQDRSEGGHVRKDETVYDYGQKVAVTTNLVSGVVRKTPIEGGVQDVLTAIYFLRTKPLSLDVEQSLVVNVSKTNYPVSVQPDSRKEMTVRPLGKVSALRMEPSPTLNVVSANGGRMWFWVSDDDRRVPLQVVASMKIGSARLVLTGATGMAPNGNGASQKDVPAKAGPTTNFTSGTTAGRDEEEGHH